MIKNESYERKLDMGGEIDLAILFKKKIIARIFS